MTLRGEKNGTMWPFPPDEAFSREPQTSVDNLAFLVNSCLVGDIAYEILVSDYTVERLGQHLAAGNTNLCC